MRKYLFIFGGVLVLLVTVFFLQSFIRSNLDFLAKNATLKANDETIRLEVADTPEKREIGLSNKSSLADNRGMLFVFDTPGSYNFWMKDMDFPIDIIFLSGNRVTTIHENVPAPENDSQNLTLYAPKEESDRVIELPAGRARELGITEGQELTIEL
jgi:uncharacterized protein